MGQFQGPQMWVYGSFEDSRCDSRQFQGPHMWCGFGDPGWGTAEWCRSLGAGLGQATQQDRVLSACPTGYQRQLTYKRQDGSYSAFGERDASGSMW